MRFPRAGRIAPSLALALAVLAVLAVLAARGDEQAPAAKASIPADEFLIVPLRVHVLTADDLPEVDCRLTNADVERIVGKVNGIWHEAGIHWGLESIVHEPAARRRRFRLVRELQGEAPLGLYRILLPESSRAFDGLHVYYVHQLPVNGVYMEEDFAIVQETARLRPVVGGIDEPVPRVTAHELAHALGLPHRQDQTNLLASGTTGTSLNAQEITQARRRAPEVPGVATVAARRQEADDLDARGEAAQARRIRGWLAEIPDVGATPASP